MFAVCLAQCSMPFLYFLFNPFNGHSHVMSSSLCKKEEKNNLGVYLI